jgi:hypothetical protein
VSAKLAPVRADILFLLDNSTSMGEEIEEIASQLHERLVRHFAHSMILSPHKVRACF